VHTHRADEGIGNAHTQRGFRHICFLCVCSSPHVRRRLGPGITQPRVGRGTEDGEWGAVSVTPDRPRQSPARRPPTNGGARAGLGRARAARFTRPCILGQRNPLLRGPRAILSAAGSARKRAGLSAASCEYAWSSRAAAGPRRLVRRYNSRFANSYMLVTFEFHQLDRSRRRRMSSRLGTDKG